MTDYAIVGGGRLARHFSEYFRLLEIPHTRWARKPCPSLNSCRVADAGQRLRETVEGAERVLLLVSDTAIATVLKQYPFLHERQLIHCSGALSFPGIAGAHPLMTFADELYQQDVYQSVPFMLEAGHSFEQLFPSLDNPHFPIAVKDKASYHALCVVAGNFSQLLWKGVHERFYRQLGIPVETLHPYLKQVLENFVRTPETALTGPLARNDLGTIDRNIQALENDPLGDLYRAFVSFHEADSGTEKCAERTQLEQVI